MIDEATVARMFSEGYDCSQIVLSDVCDVLGMTKNEAYTNASALGIGLFKGSTCGAALGALIALGIRYGNVKPGDMKTKFELFDKRDEFLRRFAELNGSTVCSELLGEEVTSVPQLMETNVRGVYKNCPRYCVNAMMILEEMLKD